MRSYSSHTCFRLLSLLPIPGHPLQCCLAPRSARNPSYQSERQLIWERQSGFGGRLSTNRWPLQQASSTLCTLMDGEPSCLGGHCSLSGGTGHKQALGLSRCFHHCTPSSRLFFVCLLPNYYMSRLTFSGGVPRYH
jgi:hypothetical protein